jgi:hypothetical protein
VKRHREAIVALDFFTVPTLTFHLLYGFFVIDHHWTKRDEKGTDAFRLHSKAQYPSTAMLPPNL